MSSTKIEWTESTWNPVTGCTKISPGCVNCYAERMAKRLHAMGQENYANGFRVTTHPHAIDLPLKWKKPRMIFVNSMSDLFHKNIPGSFIKDLFDVMQEAEQHVFQILTKRSGRLLEMAEELRWPDNVWMGVTVEHSDYVSRIDDLRKVPAAIKFLSMEPLLSAIPDMNLNGIDWVIVGGESGPGARPIQKEWIVDIKNQCQSSNTSFFFKQWGGVNKKKAGNALDGKIYQSMPEKIA